MRELSGNLPAAERVVLAVDTSQRAEAVDLAQLAAEAGASVIKEGLELASSPGSSWEFCSHVAGNTGLDWVADAKIDDIPNTTAGIIRNLVQLDHPPVAITIHTHSGVDSMKAARDIAGERDITMLGVTELTSITEEELRTDFNFILAELGLREILAEINMQNILDQLLGSVRFRNLFVHGQARKAAAAQIGGLVASAKELVDPIKSDPLLADKITMIPGTRSPKADTHDQVNVDTPKQAIVNGAQLLVIGRQVTQAKDPVQAFRDVVAEIQQGLDERAQVA